MSEPADPKARRDRPNAPAEPQRSRPGRPASFLKRPIVTVGSVLAILLALQVPISMIRGLIDERRQTREEARAEVTATWGGPQSLVGPRLVVPFTREGDDTDPQRSGTATFLPVELSVDGDVLAEPLRRGLFTIPAYRASLRLEGSFDELDPGGLGLDSSELLWDEARLVLEMPEPRGLGAGSTLSWDGEAIPILPGSEHVDPTRAGVHARVPMGGNEGASFRLDLELKGSGELRFAPFGETTGVSITSNWGDPSFVGGWLPDERSVESAGFEATWRVPFLGRDYPQQWTSGADPHEQILESAFGVSFLSPVDHYRMSERSTKYAALFLALTFGLFWLFDVTMGIRVHPIQYLLVGAAMCLFYLLELSLGEHLGFGTAYTIAAGAVVMLVASYTKAVLGSSARGAAVGGSMGLLYAYLLALLMLEEYALLAGSVGLFVVLAVIMHQTRWIDWHRLGDELVTPAPDA